MSKPKVTRGALIDDICQKVGMTRRIHEGQQYPTKQELLRISSYIDFSNSRIKSLEEEIEVRISDDEIRERIAVGQTRTDS